MPLSNPLPLIAAATLLSCAAMPALDIDGRIYAMPSQACLMFPDPHRVLCESVSGGLRHQFDVVAMCPLHEPERWRLYFRSGVSTDLIDTHCATLTARDAEGNEINLDAIEAPEVTTRDRRPRQML